jgi:hypothetical protein
MTAAAGTNVCRIIVAQTPTYARMYIYTYSS